MKKFITLMEPVVQNEESMKLALDIVAILNKTNNTASIATDSKCNICLFGDNEMHLQLGCGKSSGKDYYDAYLFYGNQKISTQSFSFDTYEAYVNAVCEMVNKIYNKKSKSSNTQ